MARLRGDLGTSIAARGIERKVQVHCTILGAAQHFAGQAKYGI